MRRGPEAGQAPSLSSHGHGAELNAAVLSERQAPTLDALAESWWLALDAARSALSGGGRSFTAQELGERHQRLAEEQRVIAGRLRELARDRQMDSLLVNLIAAPTITVQMLGLPAGVAACVFDLDGVLTTSASVHVAAWADTLDAFLLARAERGRHQFVAFDRRHDYAALIAGRPRLDGARAFLASRGISIPEGNASDPADADTVHGLANRKNAALQRHLDREGIAAFDGSRDYLRATRLIGLRRAVVSASANTTTLLERAGLAGLVDQQIDGNTIEAEGLRPKPAPDTLLAACQLLHVQPEETAAFETAPVGVTAARSAGVKFVAGVDRGSDTAALRESDADIVVGDLADLFLNNPRPTETPPRHR